MIDASQLLTDLQKLLKRLEADLRQRCVKNADVNARVQSDYEAARKANRTSQSFPVWRDEFITQASVAWVLACVFVRFMEDNELIETPRIGGTGERLQLARDNHELYFRDHPTESDREYLKFVFREVAKLPGAKEVFDERHNPLWTLELSGDGAGELLNFWQQVEPETGRLRYDFTDAEWSTRFLGDLYQDLSEAARKRYALLQTPVFVEEFILDRTLTPAINEFGYRAVRLIDPTCGSGHFLLGAFHRLLTIWLREAPGVNARELAQRALDGVYGVDLNPFAVSIARFRLLVAALRASGEKRLRDAPDFSINLAAGDSLLHGSRPAQEGAVQQNYLDTSLKHVYETEDADELRRILRHGTYHVVVGNPPYITPKDAALNVAYRQRFGSCHMKYSLAVPFMERFFDLAIKGQNGDGAGYVGMITANSFMKREFGKKLIEQYIPRWNLTHVIDTAGAYIPGHGTPTVVLFGRNSRPVGETVRAVMGIKGEPQTPADPSRGLVWTSIVEHVDVAGATTEFVSVSDTARTSFHRHPWSIGGGGAAELREIIEEAAEKKLEEIVELIGVFGMTNADEAMLATKEDFARRNVEQDLIRHAVTGEEIRDYLIARGEDVLFPYRNESLVDIEQEKGIHRWLWKVRTTLGNRATFSKRTYFEEGRAWWAWHQIALERIRTPLLITFAEIATHNHFVLDRGRKVFTRTAPVIKLPNGASEDEHLALLGLLNCSTACFWMKQVAHQKQMMGGDGIRIVSKSKVPYAFSGTQLGQMPIPAHFFKGQLSERLLALSRLMDNCAIHSTELSAARVITESLPDGITGIRETWQKYLNERARLRAQMIFLQEEIDFTAYCLFGLADESLLSNATEPFGALLEAGERPFCIITQKNEEGFTVPSDVPHDWPSELRVLWEKRIDAIKASPALTVIEDAHYKRRWIGRQGLFNHARSNDDLQDACKEWMLNHLEDARYWSAVELTTTARLSDRARTDTEFMQVAEMYRERADFDVSSLVAELVKSEAVPFLPVLRYKRSGLEKHREWEQTWEMQRAEDRIRDEYEHAQAMSQTESSLTPAHHEQRIRELIKQQLGESTVPPKYKSTDFLEGSFWRLRGKLDVPKERFISYPRCERDADPSLVIAWAGWNHLQQAQALAAYYETVKSNEGWGPPRLVPLLAGVLELLQWLEQWHNEVDPAYGIGMGDFFRGFVEEEARALGLTLNRIREWTP